MLKLALRVTVRVLAIRMKMQRLELFYNLRSKHDFQQLGIISNENLPHVSFIKYILFIV